mmetsp:Transcript_11971/g.13783  ORF Transcript_11971/g.13783 Transcript_11971/m.13783 type:complete len:190 (-) Transcript_11971:209-778(-)
MTRRRSRSQIAGVGSENMACFQPKRCSSLPPRPAGNGWEARVWDNMYSESVKTKNALQEDVRKLLHEGESLRSVLRKLEGVLGESQEFELVEQVSEEFHDCEEFGSIVDEEECKEGDFVNEKSSHGKPKRQMNVTQRLFNTFIYAMAGRKVHAQTKRHLKKEKSQKRSKSTKSKNNFASKALTHLQSVM